MKFSIIIFISISTLLLCFQIQAIHTPDELFEYGRKCNGTYLDVASLTIYIPPTTESGKCMMLCLLKLVGAIDTRGLYSESGTMSYLRKHWKGYPADQLASVSETCTTATAAIKDLQGSCDYAHKTAICMTENMRQSGFFKDLAYSAKEIADKIGEQAVEFGSDVQEKISDRVFILFNKTKELFPGSIL